MPAAARLPRRLALRNFPLGATGAGAGTAAEAEAGAAGAAGGWGGGNRGGRGGGSPTVHVWQQPQKGYFHQPRKVPQGRN